MVYFFFFKELRSVFPEPDFFVSQSSRNIRQGKVTELSKRSKEKREKSWGLLLWLGLKTIVTVAKNDDAGALNPATGVGSYVQLVKKMFGTFYTVASIPQSVFIYV